MGLTATKSFVRVTTLPMKAFVKKLFCALISLVAMFSLLAPKMSADNAAPKIQISSINSSKYTITITFPQAIPAGNITDIEVWSTNNQKLWQYFTPSGGTTFSATTPTLPSPQYYISVGLFTPNWSDNYAWFNHIATIDSSSPTPTTPTSSQNTISGPAQVTAMNAYNDWKAKYVVTSGDSLRVVRPENNNDTVSEGMGYGMLLAAFAKDQNTFAGLWNYTKKYLDSKGLMNWQIDSSGHVIGSGSATDADEDIAYALIKANNLWGQGYDSAAKSMITAMKAHDVTNNYMNPGDNWTGQVMNPSYVAPSYYNAFANMTGDSAWNQIASQNSSWLTKVANSSTGFVPDWINVDFSSANIGFDSHQHDFYYDALRNPIRMLIDYKATGDGNASQILQKQAAFLSGIGVDKLQSGYTLSGLSFTNYLDTAFLAAYTAAAQINPNSQFAQTLVNKLVNTAPNGYFGTSLRAITLFVIAGNN